MATDTPDPADARDALLSELADEYAARYRAGERPPLREYLNRYPELASDIRELFPAMIAIERVKEHQQEDWHEAASPPSPALQQLGDFRIIREIGKGGMGIVYEAEQVSLGRRVALKVIPKQLLVDVRTKHRFQREAKAAARLHHTNIVPIFGVGEHDGLPYYVMQFIHGAGLDVVIKELARMEPGGPLPAGSYPTSLCDASIVAQSLATGVYQSAAALDSGAITTAHVPYSPPALTTVSSDSSGFTSSVRLTGQGESRSSGKARKLTYWQSVARVGMQVADALEYAHRQGILHRDIKPSNLLLDARGTVWVTDFGLAKSDDQQDLTRSSDVLGTLRYMPPEAFDGNTDARSDVYSLGLTIYELLCLRPAFDKNQRMHLTKQVTTDEPARMNRLNPHVPRDLVTIVHKAIERDPAHRYRTANELATDLQHFIDDEPIQARRVSPREHFVRWCRHNPLVAGLLASLGLLLLGVAAVSVISAIRIAGARDDATRNAIDALAAKEREGGQRKLAEGNASESHQRLIRLHVANGSRLLDESDLFGALPWFTEALALDQGDDSREERHRTRIAAVLANAPKLVHLWRHDHEVEYVAFSPDGRRIVTASKDRTARVWDAGTGDAVCPPLRHGDIVLKAAFSPDGRYVVTASHDRTARVWDISTGRAVSPALVHDGSVVDASFSFDGRLVLTACTDGSARIWDALTGHLRTPPLTHSSWLNTASFSPDGRYVVTASNDRTAQVWDAATGKKTGPRLSHEGPVTSAVFSPNGRQVVTASDDRTARIWDTVTGQPIGPPLEHGDRVLRAEFSPDGKFVSTCGYDTTARVWNVATGREVTAPFKHRNSVRSASFSPDGRYIVTSSYDHTARVWEIATGAPVTPPLRHNFLVENASFSPDGRRVVTASSDWTVRMWELAGRENSRQTFRHGQEVRCAAFSPDGHSVATASTDGRVIVWSAISGQPLTGPLRHDAAISHVCFSPDGHRVLTASADFTARVWEVATGRELIPPLKHRDVVVQATFSPEGDRVLTASADRTAQVWNSRTGAPVGAPLEHRERLFSAEFSPDSHRVVTASGDGSAHVWDATTGTLVARMEHQGPVEAASFSPDGRRVVTASADYTARVWDADTGVPLTDPLRHGAGVAAASFSPDGLRVVTGSRQGTARVWDAATGAPVTPLLKHGRGQIRVSFSPDGRRVATAGGDYAARLWDAATAESLGPSMRHGGWVFQIAFSPDGGQLLTASHDGTAAAWDLPRPDSRPLNDLVLLAQVLSAQRVDASDGLVEVEPAIQRRALEELRTRYPADFGGSLLESLAWHEQEAAACLREKNGPAALFHLLKGR